MACAINWRYIPECGLLVAAANEGAPRTVDLLCLRRIGRTKRPTSGAIELVKRHGGVLQPAARGVPRAALPTRFWATGAAMLRPRAEPPRGLRCAPTGAALPGRDFCHVDPPF